MPSLTLVIPCYNEQDTLERCIAKVLELAAPDLTLQIVIVDDCSKDASAVIASRLASTKACFFR